MIVWWFMYLVISDDLCLGQLMTEFFKQAIPNLGAIMSFSLPVGIVLGEILSGIWELTVSPLFEHDRDDDSRAGNLCSRPFEQFATSLGYKIAAKRCYEKNKIANITTGEFSSIFNRENAYNASEIHFALARSLGGVSIGLLGGLILGLLFRVNFLWKYCKKSKICICDLLCSSISILLILAGLVVAIYLYIDKYHLITVLIIALIFIPVSFFAFCLSLRYRDFANFIIIISKRCNAQLGKRKI